MNTRFSVKLYAGTEIYHNLKNRKKENNNNNSLSVIRGIRSDNLLASIMHI